MHSLKQRILFTQRVPLADVRLFLGSYLLEDHLLLSDLGERLDLPGACSGKGLAVPTLTLTWKQGQRDDLMEPGPVDVDIRQKQKLGAATY